MLVNRTGQANMLNGHHGTVLRFHHRPDARLRTVTGALPPRPADAARRQAVGRSGGARRPGAGRAGPREEGVIHCRGQFPSGALVWAAVALAIAFAVSSNAQAQTWDYSGYWQDPVNPGYQSCEIWLTFNGTNINAIHKCGGAGGNGDYPTTWNIDSVAGDTYQLSGATGQGYTATGWVSPTHHHVDYNGGNGNGIIEGDGNNSTGG